MPKVYTYVLASVGTFFCYRFPVKQFAFCNKLLYICARNRTTKKGLYIICLYLVYSVFYFF